MGKQFTWKGNGPNLIGSDVDDDELNGGNGPNRIQGLGGNDRLSGGNHNDTLEGGAGNDTLIGGDGADTMSGGAGSDMFVYTDHWQSQYIPSDRDGQFDVDAIPDFNVAEDKIDLSQVANGAVTDFAQISQEAAPGGTLVHVDIAGLETNDMGILLLGVAAGSLTADNFVFAS